MKRFLVTILALLYMASAMGATVHLHYCMGRFVGASLTHSEADHKCGKCGMEKNSQVKGCCKDDHKTIKLSDQHMLAKVTHNVTEKHAAEYMPASYLIYSALVRLQEPINIALANAPPERQHTPLYIQLRNLRI